MYPRLRHYPKSITVMGVVWEVRFVRKMPDGSDSLGLTWMQDEDRFIYIRLGQSPKERLKTFVHEAIHAIEFTLGFRIDHRHVYKLEDGFSEFFCENFVAMCELAMATLKP